MSRGRYRGIEQAQEVKAGDRVSILIETTVDRVETLTETNDSGVVYEYVDVSFADGKFGLEIPDEVTARDTDTMVTVRKRPALAVKSPDRRRGARDTSRAGVRDRG